MVKEQELAQAFRPQFQFDGCEVCLLFESPLLVTLKTFGAVACVALLLAQSLCGGYTECSRITSQPHQAADEEKSQGPSASLSCHGTNRIYANAKRLAVSSAVTT